MSCPQSLRLLWDLAEPLQAAFQFILHQSRVFGFQWRPVFDGGSSMASSPDNVQGGETTLDQHAAKTKYLENEPVPTGSETFLNISGNRNNILHYIYPTPACPTPAGTWTYLFNKSTHFFFTFHTTNRNTHPPLTRFGHSRHSQMHNRNTGKETTWQGTRLEEKGFAAQISFF